MPATARRRRTERGMLYKNTDRRSAEAEWVGVADTDRRRRQSKKLRIAVDSLRAPRRGTVGQPLRRGGETISGRNEASLKHSHPNVPRDDKQRDMVMLALINVFYEQFVQAALLGISSKWVRP